MLRIKRGAAARARLRLPQSIEIDLLASTPHSGLA